MGKNPPISEREFETKEAPDLPEGVSDFLDQIIAALGREDGLSKDIRDYYWNGGLNPAGERRLTDDEVEQYISGNLEDVSDLEMVFINLARKHFADESDERIKQRARRAASALTGSASKKPRVTQPTEEELRQIARAYMRVALELSDEEQYLERLIFNLLDRYKLRDPTQKEISDAVRTVKNAFQKNFQRLMFKVVFEGCDEQEQRRWKLERMANQLSNLHDLSPLPRMQMKQP